ncbi:MAG: HNH endonuclease [Anaerolineales bacterium]
MKTTLALQSTIRFANRLKKLHALRVKSKALNPARRKSLTGEERDLILQKTGKRCHICGGKIKRDEIWQADHILAHTHGGVHSVENYLPAHSICNNYRWHYGAEEFQWILKLGVWTRTLMEKGGQLGITLAEKFIKHERNRISRQRNSSRQSKG